MEPSTENRYQGKYNFGYYCLDQAISLGINRSVYLVWNDGGFQFLNELSPTGSRYEPFDIFIHSVTHAQLGEVCSIAIDLTYTIETVNGDMVAIDSEQELGLIESSYTGDKEYLTDASFIVTFSILRRHYLINLSAIILSGRDPFLFIGGQRVDVPRIDDREFDRDFLTQCGFLIEYDHRGIILKVICNDPAKFLYCDFVSPWTKDFLSDRRLGRLLSKLPKESETEVYADATGLKLFLRHGGIVFCFDRDERNLLAHDEAILTRFELLKQPDVHKIRYVGNMVV